MLLVKRTVRAWPCVHSHTRISPLEIDSSPSTFISRTALTHNHLWSWGWGGWSEVERTGPGWEVSIRFSSLRSPYSLQSLESLGRGWDCVWRQGFADSPCLCRRLRERVRVRVAKPRLLCGGKGGWGCVWSGGRGGACEEGFAGCVWDGEPQHTRHGGPKPANYAAQGSGEDLPEPPREVAENLRRGLCAWGLPGNSLGGCDAPATCMPAGVVFDASPGGSSRRRDGLWEDPFLCARLRSPELLKPRMLIPEILQNQPPWSLAFWTSGLLWEWSLASFHGCRNRGLRLKATQKEPGDQRPGRFVFS